jgi:tetratricopeptide (TPR) repeat protein
LQFRSSCDTLNNTDGALRTLPRAEPKQGQRVSMMTFLGVYSSLTQGTSTGRGAVKRKQYWFAWDCGDEDYRVQALDGAFQPQGDTFAIEPATFRVTFTPEPSILAAPVRRGQAPAAPEKTATQIAAERADVENLLRAHFGSLLMKIRRGDDLAATIKALQDVAEVEEGIVPEHKHMFAEFGINLRKGKLPEIALAHAKRALALAPGDSHAHFNIARIYHTLGKLGEAEQHLLAALEFSPELEYARMYLSYIGKERNLQKFDAQRERRR